MLCFLDTQLMPMQHDATLGCMRACVNPSCLVMSSSSSSPPQPPSSCPVPTLTWLPFRRCCCRLVWRHLRPLLVLPEAVQRHVVLGWGRRQTNGAAGSPCLDVQRPSWWRTLGPGIFDKQRMVYSQPAVVLLQTCGQQLSTRPSTAPAETAGAGSSGAAQAPADSLLPPFHQTCAWSPPIYAAIMHPL